MDKRVKYFIKHNENIISTSQFVELGFTKPTLAKYVRSGELERITHGIYAIPNTVIDDMFILSLRCKHAIFSHESALFLCNLSERTPFKLTVTIPSNKMLPLSMRNTCDCFYITPDLFNIGVIERKTTFGNIVRCYNAERTICDILRSRSRIDEETVVAALKNYARSKEKDVFRLYEYSKKFKVSTQVRDYMGVLL
ncbi:MAG: type IV toxin-antitoxin system AbiEi family antitoxin domain-containing protein [Treponema sp.]|nr:type IV toxin-antitoxin system AbiEi family antitoxin domain-containing protein [Treponema sp.]